MNVLFVCEGNINRSQMAAGFLRALRPGVSITSAGTAVPAEREGERLDSVSTESVESMAEDHIDIHSYTIRQLTPAMVDVADKIVLTGPTPGAPLPQYLMESPKLETWDVPDPGYGQISIADAKRMIKEKVERFVQTIRE